MEKFTPSKKIRQNTKILTFYNNDKNTAVVLKNTTINDTNDKKIWLI